MAAVTVTRASLVVLNWEGRDVLRRCVDSLLCAAGDDDEIIVVDNASTDASADDVASLPNISLIRLRENRFLFALNDGLEAAKGTYVAFLNNDVLVEPAYVDRTIARFEDGEDVFAVCPRILTMDGADQGSRTAGFWHRGLLFYRPLPHSPEPTDCFFAVAGQSIFRRDMLLEIGSLDPLFRPMYHEDIELSYRAWKRGWRIRYAPDAVVHHVGGHSSRRAFSPAQLRSFVRQNEHLIVWKDVTDWSLLAGHALLTPARLLAACSKGDWPTLIGVARALGRAPEVLQARARARSHMILSDRETLRRISSIT